MASDLERLVSDLQTGHRRALARVLTWVEDGDPARLREVIGAIHPATGASRVIGITGPPGVGKSTLTSALAVHLRSLERTVGVLAVDPSSPYSGGALLGDRIRMQGHHADAGVFIRSMASRGHLGGLSFATPQALLVMEAAGFDYVIVETVGVGQSEVEVAANADTAVVVQSPGMGDGIQAAKAGILEVADVLAINKADQSGAGKLESELRGMLEMRHAVRAADAEPGWWPPIVRSVAVRSEGITELVEALNDHWQFLTETGKLEERRRARALHAVREIALETVRRRFKGLDTGHDPFLDELATKVAGRALDPYAAAADLLAAVYEVA